VIRYFGEVWLGVALGRESTSFLKTHVWQFTGSAVALFAVLYGLMVWRHRAARFRPVPIAPVVPIAEPDRLEL
jgi:hypothetical protein